MAIIFILTLIFNQSALATEFEVIPLNPTSEKVLKSSPLSPYVASLDQAEKEFHSKTVNAYKKMTSLIDFKKVEALDFIYDCRFLTEAAFLNKYSSLPKLSLLKARHIASEVYRP